MNTSEALLQAARLPAPFPGEIYVMNYLLALHRQHFSTYNHPVETLLRLPLGQAYLRLRLPDGAADLAQALECSPTAAFEHLRQRLDGWDGVRIPESGEPWELTEADAEMLLEPGCQQMAARRAGYTGRDLAAFLFDPARMAQDLSDVSGPLPGAQHPERPALKAGDILSLVSASATLRQQIKLNLDQWDWWAVLERWVNPAVQAEMAARLGEQARPVRVLYSLFTQVKQELAAARAPGTAAAPPSPLSETTFGSLLPEQARLFWEHLETLSADGTASLALDGLNDARLMAHSAEHNVRQALDIASEFMPAQVEPLLQEFNRLDVYGMLVLRQRLQVIQDDLLASAQRHAAQDLEMPADHALEYFQDLIRFNCQGEYRTALHNLLNVRQLSLRQMGVAYQAGPAANTGPDTIEEAALRTFDPGDNPRFNLAELLRPGERPLQPPRLVNPGELLIAVQVGGRWSEVICLTNLAKTTVAELQAALPRTVKSLAGGQTLADRILDTPLPVPMDRQAISNALLGQIEDLTRALVLSEANRELSHELGPVEAFGKLPAPAAPGHTLVQPLTLDQLRAQVQGRYAGEGG